MSTQLQHESWLDELAGHWKGRSAAFIADNIISWLDRLGDYTRDECIDCMEKAVTVIRKRQRMPVLRKLCCQYYDQQHWGRDIAVRALLDWIAVNQ